MRKTVSVQFNFINRLLSKRYKALLISLTCMIIVPGFFEHTQYQSFVAISLNELTILLSIYAIHESRKQLQLGLVAAVVVFAINQIGFFRNAIGFDFYLSFLIYLVFFIFVAFRLMRMILVTERVRAGVLYAAVIVYLLIGVVGGYLFMLIENASPGSLNNLSIDNITNPSHFYYFSFTALSTLGIGDITPATAPTRSLCMILSVIGPLYLTVLVALLVSRFERDDL